MPQVPSADQEEISRPSRKSAYSTQINFCDDPKCKKGRMIGNTGERNHTQTRAYYIMF